MKEPTKGGRQTGVGIKAFSDQQSLPHADHALNETLECFKLKRNYPKWTDIDAVIKKK